MKLDSYLYLNYNAGLIWLKISQNFEIISQNFEIICYGKLKIHFGNEFWC